MTILGLLAPFFISLSGLQLPEKLITTNAKTHTIFSNVRLICFMEIKFLQINQEAINNRLIKDENN
tara:strand:- start:1028 stop:1225 length:198 start_codon:yes stop_codon:yes gene_type:complete